MSEISQFCKYDGNGWVTPTSGERGWEEVPYWLKGYTDLGFLLGDKRIQAEARKWLEAVLANQRPDGYFGTQKNLVVKRGDQPEMNTDKPSQVIDLWPNMIMLYPLRTLYEATGDRRVLDFMLKYFEWQRTIPREQFLPASWQKYRGGDNLDSIYWLYNRTGAAWLLDLARQTHERTADWFGNIPTWHGVNISQGFREPRRVLPAGAGSCFHRRHGKELPPRDGHLWAGARWHVRRRRERPARTHRTAPGRRNLFDGRVLVERRDAAQDHRRHGLGRSRRRCRFQFAARVAHARPQGLHYLTAPNQVQLDRKSKAPMLDNDGDMFSYNPYQYRCCQHNVAHAWPYYAEHLWMATADNGLAAVLYAASSVEAKVADGATVKMVETTGYPFDDTITLKFTAPHKVKFPLMLRVPAWAAAPELSINGAKIAAKAVAGWITVNREWTSGDIVTLRLPMKIALKTWTANRGTVSVYRGPLAYSLKIGERWQQYGSDEKWPAFEVFATTPWNYALVADDGVMKVETAKTVPAQPFTPDAAPVRIRAKARRVPGWGLEPNGLLQEVPVSPVSTQEPLEDVTLIPMGCARLRIASFPAAR